MYGGPKIVCFIRWMIQVASQNIAGLCDSSACTCCKVGIFECAHTCDVTSRLWC